MKEFIDKLISRLKEEKATHTKFYRLSEYREFPEVKTRYELIMHNLNKTIEIINQLAEEYKGGWIPCSERMPEEHDSLFAKYKGTSEWSIGMYEKYSDDVNVTVEYKDGTRRTKTLHTIDGVWWEDGIVPYKVIAWQPQPAPYKEGCD